MLSLRGVSKSYFGQPKVLDDIDLHLDKGDFLYVVGGSGVGKSSLLRMMATEEVPSLGVVSLFGYNIARVSPSTLRSIRRAVGYVPQGVQLIPDLSVYDNVALSVSLAGGRAKGIRVRQRVQEILERLGLIAKLNQPASVLSGGEAQRVAIARAVIREPEVLVADEPTGAQDRDYTWGLMDLFVKQNLKQTTVILATHNHDIVRRVPKKCALLKGGHMTIEDSRCI